jgi:NTE family protein
MLTTLQRRNGKPAVAGDGWRNTVGRWFGGGEERPILPSLADVVSNSIAIMQGRISRSRLAGEPADVLIAPRLGQLNLLDYHRGSEAIAAGRKATEHMLPLLHSLLD